jgi:hypothetical protein
MTKSVVEFSSGSCFKLDIGLQSIDFRQDLQLH